MSVVYVCKMCGRSMRAEEKPACCYFDHMDAIENISDEDAVKMGLNIPEGEIFEFPGDVRWDPVTGEPATVTLKKIETGSGWPKLVVEGRTLRQFQDAIMVEVRA